MVMVELKRTGGSVGEPLFDTMSVGERQEWRERGKGAKGGKEKERE